MKSLGNQGTRQSIVLLKIKFQGYLTRLDAPFTTGKSICFVQKVTYEDSLSFLKCLLTKGQ